MAREVFRTYNYHEIRTPILEETALFARGVGDETDIVGKEMYTFEDRDGSSLTLRPENTASVMRAYIEHRLDQIPGVKKLYYMGPMFRRERPQKGRYRQFFQIGAEAIGSESPLVDAEVIEMVVELLRRSGLAGFHGADEFGGRSELPPGVCRAAARKAAGRGVHDVRRLPAAGGDESAARARLQGARRPAASSKRCRRFWIICDGLCRRISRPCEACWIIAESRTKYGPRLVRGLDYYMRTTFEITQPGVGIAEHGARRRAL